MNLLGGYIKGLLGKKSLGRNPMWESIELMPYWNWKQVIETGDLKYIYKSCEGRVGKRLIELWEDLQDQHIQTFGLESALIQNIRAKKKVCKLINKYIPSLIKRDTILNLTELYEKMKSTSNVEMSDFLSYIWQIRTQTFAHDVDHIYDFYACMCRQ